MSIESTPNIGSIRPAITQPQAGKHSTELKTAQPKKKAEDSVEIESFDSNEAVYKLDLGSTSKYEHLRKLVANLLEEQGALWSNSTDEAPITPLQEMTPEEAQALVAEDGYFGVEKTSDRIVEFAIHLSGSDPSNLDEIKKGIDKGFEMARKAFGGTLPEISNKTYDAIMQKLDKWAEEQE